MSDTINLTEADPFDVTDALQLAIGSITAATVLDVDPEEADEKLDDLLKAPSEEARDALIEVIMDALAIHELFETAVAEGALNQEEQAGLRECLRDHQQEALGVVQLLTN